MRIKIRLVKALLEESFGQLCAEVGCCVFRTGRATLFDIRRKTRLSPLNIRAALCVLIQHGIAHYFSNQDNGYEIPVYSLDFDAVVRRIRYCRYIKAAKELYGEEGKQIVEIILINGRANLNHVLELASNPAIRDTFTKMACDYYLKYSDSNSSLSVLDDNLKRQKDDIAALGLMPKLKDVKEIMTKYKDLEKDATILAMGIKRKEFSETEAFKVDPSAFFVVNFSFFDVFLKNKFLVEEAERKINQTAAKILEVVLKLNNTFQINQLGSVEIFAIKYPVVTPAFLLTQKLKDVPIDFVVYTPSETEKIKGYLELLVQEKLLGLDKDSNYMADYSVARESVVLNLAISIVETKSGRNSARVFRALCLRGKMEEKHLNGSCMLPGSEAAVAAYQLLMSKFVTLDCIPRSSDKAPSRTTYIYSVNPALPKILKNYTELATVNHLERSKNHTLQYQRQLRRSKALNTESDFDYNQKIKILRGSVLRLDMDTLFL